MDFNLTEEHKLIRQGVREFCDKYVCPIADAVDQEPRFPAETV
ncbi:MAG: acyl-CoA dehydrogenase family protein, partial [Syntrophobacteraceae bacterium]